MIKNTDLSILEQHWAVASISDKLRKECFDDIGKKVVQKSVGEQI